MGRRVVARGVLVLTLLWCMVSVAAAQAQPAGVEGTTPSVTAAAGYPTYCCFNTVLPPGNSGFISDSQLATFETLKDYPANTHDQFEMYQDLNWGYPTLTDATISDYFKNEDIGMPTGVVSEVTPEPGVTIYYDKYGVPHIFGQTRAELEFGAGYALGQLRLFQADALRHVGRSDVAAFAGGANATQDALQWAIAPYTEQDLDNQVTALEDNPEYSQVYQDGINYIAGINAYIAAADKNPLELMPAEYLALGKTPQPFVPADLVAIASAIAGAEGVGGGTELPWTLLMQDLEAKLGTTKGYEAFLDLHSIDDPATPTSIKGVNYPYLTIPSKVIPGSEGIPDPGSVTSAPEQVITSGSGAKRHTSESSMLKVMTEGERFGRMLPSGESNALLISAKDSASGHPLALMGPQLGYFSPAIIMEEQLVGPGIAAEGAAVPGASQYVELGHGLDYAWSATSGYEGVIASYAVPLCNPSGGAVTTSSDDYVYDGKCLAMEDLVRTESWTPNLADSTPAGSQTLNSEVTDFGIVEARGTVRGRPVAFTEDRSTYDHELDSSLGFMLFDDPSEMTGPVDFIKAASKIGYAFNWLYADSKHIAYYNAGLLPIRHADTNPLYPTMSTYPWVDFNGTNNTSADLPWYDHPHVIDQSWITSWNNHEAPEYSSTDDLTNYSSVWRSQLLDAGIETDLKHGKKMTLAELVQVMERAGLVDLRAWAVGPYLLKILGTPSNPALANAVSELRTWIADGSLRTSSAEGQTTYENSQAIQIMDAWWPLLVKAIYEPALGTAAFNQLEAVDPTDQPPNDQAPSPGGGGEEHFGSAWDIGFYGTVQTDLEDVLGLHPTGALSLKYCGDGSLSACRQELESSLAQAIAEPATEVYPGYTGTPGCAAGDQLCWDEISFDALGAISQPLMSWINRPTFQQADEITGHRPYPALNPCWLAEYPRVAITTAATGPAHRLTISGSATPRDCNTPPAHLKSVRVAVGLGEGHGTYRWLQPNGALGPVKRGAPSAWLPASGTATWKLRLAGVLPAGHYQLEAQVTDATDNVATATPRTLVVSTRRR